MLKSMFVMQLPLLEKIVRPVIVYLVLIVFLRLFGKRELAQLNPFDLVVLLSLSNTVQNAIIGDDNSVSGGVIGAFSLLTVNWLLTRFLYHSPKLTRALQGTSTKLIDDGKIDHAALTKEALTHTELLSVLHRQSINSVEEVQCCVLEPNGTFFIEARKPTLDASQDDQIASLIASVERLTKEVRDLRTQTP